MSEAGFRPGSAEFVDHEASKARGTDLGQFRAFTLHILQQTFGARLPLAKAPHLLVL